MVSSAFARARSTLPLTGCSSLFSLSRAFLRSRLLRSVSANRFAHLSSNANSTISSSSFSSSSSSLVLLLLKNTILDVFALKFSFLFLSLSLLLLLLSGGGQDTNVSQEREDETDKGCCATKFGGPRKRISADGGGSSHIGITRGSKSFGRRVDFDSSSFDTIVASKNFHRHATREQGRERDEKRRRKRRRGLILLFFVNIGALFHSKQLYKKKV